MFNRFLGGIKLRAEAQRRGLERERLRRAPLAVGGRCAQGARMRAEEALGSSHSSVTSAVDALIDAAFLN
jgi:hypothetical protein